MQGSAGDVMIGAMVKIYGDKALRDLGYYQILQIHDEIVLVSFIILGKSIIKNRKVLKETVKKQRLEYVS